jgi:dihydrofolate reductase
LASIPDLRRRISMRRVGAWQLVSLDGILERLENWAFSYSNEEMGEVSASGMARSDALLLGRVTYEHMAAYWPHQPGGTPMVDYLISVPKVVVSATLEEPLEWNNSSVIGGNVAEEIAKLKRRPGKDITVLGSGALVRSLLGDRLLDELRLTVHPVILGGGKRFFEDEEDRKGLKLVDSRCRLPHLPACRRGVRAAPPRLGAKRDHNGTRRLELQRFFAPTFLWKARRMGEYAGVAQPPRRSFTPISTP